MPNGYEFSGVNHITVTVSDMEKSLRFYRDGIGFKVVMDVENPHRNERQNLAHRAPRAGHRMVTLDTGVGPTVALTEYRGAEGQGIFLDDVGVTHFSVTVSDLKALARRLEGLGVKSPRPGFFTDPDGILVQFEEPGHAEAALARYRAQAKPG